MIMGERDEEYSLSGVLELDEGFFSTEVKAGEMAISVIPIHPFR
jgi:hypothetical protein